MARHVTEMRQNKDNKKNDFVFALNSINMADTVVAFMLNLNTKTDVSPRGLVSLLAFVHDAIFHEYKALMQKVFKNCLKLLCSFIRENQLLAIQEWPLSVGGGPSAVNLISAQVLRIFNLPYSQSQYDKEIETINNELAKSDIIYVALNVLKYINKEHISTAISLLSRLVFNSESSKTFAQQFVNCGGLNCIHKYHLLSEENLSILIVDTLSLISQLARISKDFYEAIHQANIYVSADEYHNRHEG